MKNKKFTYHPKKDTKKTWLKIALTPFKNGIQKIINLLYTTSDKMLLLDLLLKNG